MSNSGLLVQVGKKAIDHALLVGFPYVPEAISAGLGPSNISRPVYVLNMLNNGSDLVGEAVAAYASLSMLFDKIDPQLSVGLEDDAFTMYELMKQMPNTRYSDANPEYNVRSNA